MPRALRLGAVASCYSVWVALAGAIEPAPFLPPLFSDCGAGEDCNRPIVVDSDANLPILLAGNTENCSDQLFADCGYSSRGGRDVVYLYRPLRDVRVTISLCSDAGKTTFDSKLYVYTDLPCSGTPWACNEDACSDGNQPGVSELPDIALLAGQAYYIVVDGNDAREAGSFQLAIRQSEASQPCPAGSFFAQTPHLPRELWALGLSESAFGVSRLERAELQEANAPLCAISWWGLQLTDEGGWRPCSEPDPQFTLRLHPASSDPNHAGEPDPNVVLLEQRSRVWTEDTGVTYQNWTLQRYQMELRPCFSLRGGELWVSIVGEADPRCAFFWMSSPDGDGASCLTDGAGLRCAVPGESDYDLGLCLGVAQRGACCRERGQCEVLPLYECFQDPICRADANCDGAINFADISPFVAALGGEPPCRFENVDADGDGAVNFNDINPFVLLLTQFQGPCTKVQWWDPKRACQDCLPQGMAEGAVR